jgi:hypothetical protein
MAVDPELKPESLKIKKDTEHDMVFYSKSAHRPDEEELFPAEKKPKKKKRNKTFMLIFGNIVLIALLYIVFQLLLPQNQSRGELDNYSFTFTAVRGANTASASLDIRFFTSKSDRELLRSVDLPAAGQTCMEIRITLELDVADTALKAQMSISGDRLLLTADLK